jgi:hypothetical protein
MVRALAVADNPAQRPRAPMSGKRRDSPVLPMYGIVLTPQQERFNNSGELE